MQIQANIKILYGPLTFFPKHEYIALIVLVFCSVLNTSYATHTQRQKELPHSFSQYSVVLIKDPALYGPTRKWRLNWIFIPVLLVIMGVRV